jgi:ABC-2 type transport system permease protein
MTAVAVEQQLVRSHAETRPIPTSRLVLIELRKMFDTRSGFWLMASIGISAVVATGAVILFAPDKEISYATFAAAFGFPMAIILPVIAILAVTSEWSQRSGLSTFTLVPRRGRVIAAKAVAAVSVGALSIPLALAIGAVGNLVGSALAGTEVVWDISFVNALTIVLANVLGLLVGFTLGVLLRSSAAAIVTYFVYSLVLPTLAGLLAASQAWFRDLQPWVDFNFSQSRLFEDGLPAEQWGQLAVSGTLWLLLPLAVGLVLTLRSEVK